MALTIANLNDTAYSHDAFFSRVIGMIPAELYTHSVTADNSDEQISKYYKVNLIYKC